MTTNDTQRTTRAEAEQTLRWLKPDPDKPWNVLDAGDLAPLLEDVTRDYIALLDENARLRHLLAHVDRQQLIAILGSETEADRYLRWEQQPNPEPPRPRRAAALDTEQE